LSGDGREAPADGGGGPPGVSTRHLSCQLALEGPFEQTLAHARLADSLGYESINCWQLGLGVGHRVTMGDWHGQRIGNPTAETRRPRS